MRYMLEKYHTPSSRHTCPKCGRKRCFTYYIDTETGQPLDPSCGKCDHLNSCGYHLPPRAFLGRDSGYRNYSNCRNYGNHASPAVTPVFLPADLPARLMGRETVLCGWLLRHFTAETVARVAGAYRLGQWSDHRTVFWQIDRRGNVRDGKIVDHSPGSGHRLGHPSWVSYQLFAAVRERRAATVKCLFGEHLLAPATSAARTVCLVEGERTAVYCACRWPQFVWVATGGCQALKPEVLTPLQGRRVMVWPDSGEHDAWAAVLRQVPRLDYRLFNLDHLPGNTDLLDVVMNEQHTCPAQAAHLSCPSGTPVPPE